jgi:hypothetical protein
VTGADERALISGRVVRPGQSVKGFVLKKIMSRQVVLVRNGVELRLEM